MWEFWFFGFCSWLAMVLLFVGLCLGQINGGDSDGF